MSKSKTTFIIINRKTSRANTRANLLVGFEVKVSSTIISNSYKVKLNFMMILITLSWCCRR
jgi:hypothetical protein